MHKGGIPILGYALKFMAFVNYVLVISSSVLHGKIIITMYSLSYFRCRTKIKNRKKSKKLELLMI